MLRIGLEYKFKDGNGFVIVRERHEHQRNVAFGEVHRPGYRLDGKYKMFYDSGEPVDNHVYPLPALVMPVAIEEDAFGPDDYKEEDAFACGGQDADR